jgi:serine/threonine-protein kinase
MPGTIIDRYEIFQEIASGGMATVFLGRLRGGSGFRRAVAIKRLHSHLAPDAQFKAMFLDEARLAARIRHPNVVSTLDVLDHGDELFIVMDYVHGESLSKIRAHLELAGQVMPRPIVGAIVSGILQGLHAAHEAKDERGVPLSIVHRDVSPQNVLIGEDGVSRLVDFGVAKAVGRLQTTSDGQIKGKVSYMAPEQLAGRADRRSDIFAAGVILWELLTGQRLFTRDTPAETLANVLAAKVPRPRSIDPTISTELEEIVMAALDLEPDRRFATAREMDQAFVRCLPVASTFDVAEWFHASLGTLLERRAKAVAAMETQADAPSDASEPATSVATDAGSLPLLPKKAGLAQRRGLRIVAGLIALTVSAVAIAAWRGAHAVAPADAALRPPDGPAQDGAAQIAALPAVDAGERPSPPLTASVASTSAGAGPSAHPPASARGARPKPSRGDCDPPWWIDVRGSKHFKDRCL